MVRLRYTEDKGEKVLDEAVSILARGGVIAYPTESYYALGALATDQEALKKIYALKKRPLAKPLPVIIGHTDLLTALAANIPDPAKEIIVCYWPGPLTLIFEALDTLPALLTGHTGKVGVRIPGESAALHLARKVAHPVTATSANISGQPPADDPERVIRYFHDKIDLLIDGGKTPGGKPSTIIDVTFSPPRIVREGSVTVHC